MQRTRARVEWVERWEIVSQQQPTAGVKNEKFIKKNSTALKLLCRVFFILSSYSSFSICDKMKNSLLFSSLVCSTVGSSTNHRHDGEIYIALETSGEEEQQIKIGTENLLWKISSSIVECCWAISGAVERDDEQQKRQQEEKKKLKEFSLQGLWGKEKNMNFNRNNLHIFREFSFFHRKKKQPERNRTKMENICDIFFNNKHSDEIEKNM